LQPVGMVEASLAFPDEVFLPARMLHIAAVYVRPDHRHAGLGRRLLEAAIAWGREQGCVQVELNVLAGNPAHRLYEKMGFGVYEMQLRLKL
jgi:GNAT superfamily N-acetyltransferase